MSTTPEQLRLAADIIENGIRWESRYSTGAWTELIESDGPFQALVNGREIRRKPLEWPPIPEGCSLHNPDNLTPEQVGDGWRLTVEGEGPSNPDLSQLWHERSKCFVERSKLAIGGLYKSWNTYRVAVHVPFPDGSRIVDGKLVKPKFRLGDRVRVLVINEHGRIERMNSSVEFDVRLENGGLTTCAETAIEPYVWSLSRHIPGFRPLRDGEEWHCCSSHPWEEGDLNGGWRPCLLGEVPKEGDEYWLSGDGPWVPVESTWSKALNKGLTSARTRRPLPEPKKRVPLGPIDWMKDGPWWVRGSEEDRCPSMVIALNVHDISYGKYGSSSHEEAVNLQRSNDGINWTPCFREE